jgi:choline kinase
VTYRVCIPCAGTGSRLGALTADLNKSLITVANRPVLSHIIDQFPPTSQFVIALGYKGNLIQEFLMLAYPDREFFFVPVSPFDGAGSGLGLSLLACKEFLQQPFIFSSCDTLVEEFVPPPDENWMGYAEACDGDQYRTVLVSSSKVTAISDAAKKVVAGQKPYIGLAGVKDYEVFWAAMESGGEAAIRTGEVHAMRRLLAEGIRARSFAWHDTGNPIALAEARGRYRDSDSPNILDKKNEAIWFVGDNVIKFSTDKSFIKNRVARADYLTGFVPRVTGVAPHMFRYSKIDGRVLSEIVTVPIFDQLLQFCEELWVIKELTLAEKIDFKNACTSFYKDKTFERVSLFYEAFRLSDGIEMINSVEMRKLDDMLNSLDWEWLCKGLPSRYHGDLHFENIIFCSNERRFTFVDWRQDFGGSLAVGDVYYDLAKILHGLIISHELIVNNHYDIQWTSDRISYDFHRKQRLVECESHFLAWLRNRGYDVRRVSVLTALIFLNIAALHHYPYSLLLFALGKSMLNQQLVNAIGGDGNQAASA